MQPVDIKRNNLIRRRYAGKRDFSFTGRCEDDVERIRLKYAGTYVFAKYYNRSLLHSTEVYETTKHQSNSIVRPDGGVANHIKQKRFIIRLLPCRQMNPTRFFRNRRIFNAHCPLEKISKRLAVRSVRQTEARTEKKTHERKKKRSRHRKDERKSPTYERQKEREREGGGE